MTTLRRATLLAVAFLIASSISAFQAPAPAVVHRTRAGVSCYMAKKAGKKGGGGKGFATTQQREDKPTSTASAATSTTASKPSQPPSDDDDNGAAMAAAAQSAMASNQAQSLQQQVQAQSAQRMRPDDDDDLEQRRDADDMNQGKRALELLRRERAEQRDAELRRVKQLRATELYLQESPGAAAIPEKVATRMGKRMLPFVGIPLFGSMAAFVAFWYFATYKDMEFQPGMVATTTILILVSGLLGITYSLMSASWDEDREGGLLGVDEFKRNVGNIKDGLERSKENALIRERMKGSSEADIEVAIRELDARDQRERQKMQSLQSKLEDELNN